jgi:superfamily II DNA or RNA helicase
MQEPHTPPGAGEHVMVRDEAWVVLKTDCYDQVRVVHLRGAGTTNHGLHQSVVTPFDRVERIERSTVMRAVSRRRVLATAALAIADAHSWDTCWTAAAARIDLRAWQLQPALAAVQGATRILLADRVGLGKTIQAGLIISELFARGLAERALVLTPSSLREQWAGGLRHRFHLAPTVFDHAALTRTIASLPVGVNPWQTAPLIVSSIDLVKRPEVRSALEDLAFDVLVVDEAHHLAPGTERGAAVADLAARTPWVVLVTATPHSGDDAAFDFLQRIGASTGADLVTFRRSIAATSTAPLRRSRLLAVAPTDAERLMLDETEGYVRAVARSRTRSGARLVASVIARRAASNATALCGTLARRIALLSGQPVADAQPALPWEESDAADEDTPDALLAAPGLSDLEHELTWLRRLLFRAEAAAAQPSKIGVIRRLLRRTSESVIVFSEYRDVAVCVGAALRDLTTVGLLHGGLSSRERHEVVDAFNRGTVRTLVATDAAGEGLNLQRRCRLVVNVELPWMPRRLEQRVGRVDRIGQTRRVHVLQLVHRGSFESTVVARLERRRALADQRTRDRSVVDEQTPASDERQLRQMVNPEGPMPRGVRFATDGGRRSADGHILLLYGATLVTDTGRLVERLIVPIAVELLPGSASPRLRRDLLRRLAAEPAVRAAVDVALASQRARASLAIRHAATAIEQRIATCLRSIEWREARRSAWQGSLFDRAADAGGERQRLAIARIREHLVRRRDEVRALSVLRTTDAHLLAAWRN